MVTRMHYTRWEGRRLVLSEIPHVPFRLTRPRRARWYEIAGAALVSLAWFFIALEIVLNSWGCASADGYDSPPESSSPGAQPDSSGRAWCCDAKDAEGKASLVCGMRERPAAKDDVVGDTCYCHGIVRGHECIDETAWTPGTFCTQAQVVCWEEQ